MAKKKKSAINYLVIDASGSMSGLENAVEKGVQAIVAKLRVNAPDSRIIIVQFADSCKTIYDGKIETVPTTLGYRTYGGTNLYGALLLTLANCMAASEDYKSLTVISDGEETHNPRNSSTVAKVVKQARDLKVNIGLLGLDFPTSNLGALLGIDKDMTVTGRGSEEGTQTAVTTYASSIVRSSTGKRAALTKLERATIEKSPEEIAAENNEELVTLNKAAKILTKMYEGDVNQFFSVTFKKRTPPYNVRTYAKARFNIKSKMKVDGPGAAYNFLEKKLVPVWVEDVDPKTGKPTGFRSIDLNGLYAVRAQGHAFRVKTGG